MNKLLKKMKMVMMSKIKMVRFLPKVGYVVRFYPKDGADTKINSGDGRTFTFDTFVYASPKVDTFNGDNKDLQETYESNYTYISSEIDGFKALIDEDIAGNPYTVASKAYNSLSTR